jgi:hypothetical protein
VLDRADLRRIIGSPVVKSYRKEVSRVSKQIRIKPVHRDEADVERLAEALLDIVEQLDEPTLAALALDGQRVIERLRLPLAHLPRRESAA